MIVKKTFAGLLPRVHPTTLPEQMAEIALDVDLSSNVIAPLRTDRFLLNEPNLKSFMWEKCCLTKSNRCGMYSRDYLNCGRVFSSEHDPNFPRQAYSNEVCENKWYALGFPCNETPPSVSYLANTATLNKITTRSYFYTWVNAFNEESMPSPATIIENIDFDIPAIITGFVQPPPVYGVVRYKVYALIAGVENDAGGKAGEQSYFEIANIPVTQTSVTHTPLTDFIGEANITQNHGLIPVNAVDVQHFGQKQIVFMSNNQLHFSEVGNYAVAPDKFRTAFNSNVVRFVACEEYGYALTCGRPEVVSFKVDCKQGGCHAVETIQEHLPMISKEGYCRYNNTVFYTSTRGIVRLSANQFSVVTEDLLSQSDYDALQPHTMRLEVLDGYLYMFSDIKSYRLKINTSNGYTPPDIYDMTELSIRPTAVYKTLDNRLIYSDANGLWEMGQGDSYKTYKYKTKRYVMDSHINYSAIKVHSNCDKVKVTVFTSRKKCQDKAHSFNLNAKAIHRLPALRAEEYQIQFEGTATVYGLELAPSVIDLGKS